MTHTSCIILNYNDADTTLQLVNEIRNYSMLNSIIVVDNHSTNQSYESFLKVADEKVKVIQTSNNGGYGFGNNEGIRYAYKNLHADYVLVANPDVHFTNECVKSMVVFLKENLETAICAPKALKPSGEKQNLIAWKLQNKWDYAFSASMFYLKFLSNKFYKDSYLENKDWVGVDVVPGSLLMINAHYMMKYGMYDEANFLYSEEEMLAIKFRKANLKTVLLLNETYIHEHSVSISKSFPSEINKKKMNLNSRLFVLNKYYNASSGQKKWFKRIAKLALIENKLIFKIKGYN